MDELNNHSTKLNNKNDKLISMMAAIDALKERRALYCDNTPASFSELSFANKSRVDELDTAIATLVNLPSARSERDIPMKPNETIDTAWGIRKKQAVCPKCDYYLGYVEFIGNPNGKKITYCETCGQAIDWEGWEWEEE